MRPFLFEVMRNGEWCSNVMNTQRVFNAQELVRFDGGDGRRVYVACHGKVYDLTDSVSWEGGEHHGLHYAGRDMTEEIQSAPHDVDMLEGFPVLGRYEDK